MSATQRVAPVPAPIALLCLCLGCTPGDDVDRTHRVAFDDVFILESRHTVSQSVMDPIASAIDVAATRGGYLLLDGMQSKVLKIGLDGRVIGTFGRAGSGPGEMRDPLAIASFDDGGFVVLNRTGSQAVFFDSIGAQVGSWTTGIPLATSVRVLDSMTVVIFGERISSSRDMGKGPIVHVFDRVSGELLRQAGGSVEFRHAAESRMRTAEGATLGSTVMVGFTTRNDVLAFDLAYDTPATHRLTIAPGSYEEWDWDRAGHSPDPQQWMRDQTWLQRVMFASHSVLVVSFGIPHETERRFRYEYALTYLDSEASYVTQPVDVELFEVGGGRFVAFDIRSAGVDLLQYRLRHPSILAVGE